MIDKVNDADLIILVMQSLVIIYFGQFMRCHYMEFFPIYPVVPSESPVMRSFGAPANMSHIFTRDIFDH